VVGCLVIFLGRREGGGEECMGLMDSGLLFPFVSLRLACWCLEVFFKGVWRMLRRSVRRGFGSRSALGDMSPVNFTSTTVIYSPMLVPCESCSLMPWRVDVGPALVTVCPSRRWWKNGLRPGLPILSRASKIFHHHHHITPVRVIGVRKAYVRCLFRPLLDRPVGTVDYVHVATEMDIARGEYHPPDSIPPQPYASPARFRSALWIKT
jgi:hypothetical protein